MASLFLAALVVGSLQAPKGTELYDGLMKLPTRLNCLELELKDPGYRGRPAGIHHSLWIWNRGKKHAVLDKRISLHSNIFAYVFDKRHHVVAYKDWTVRTQAIAPQALSELVTVGAGDLYGVDHQFEPVILRPGTYTLIVVYEEGEGRGKSPFAGKFWQGEVRSRPTPINVVR